jgi:hypothetical protein
MQYVFIPHSGGICPNPAHIVSILAKDTDGHFWKVLV